MGCMYMNHAVQMWLKFYPAKNILLITLVPYADLDLICSISDLFGAGSETTSNSIRYTIMYLLLYPEVQRKIQKQIDDAVPHDSLPSLEDRDK